jgi:hypothetical protein
VERNDFFKVKIFDPQNGAKISRKDSVIVNVIGDITTKIELQRIEEHLRKYLNKGQTIGYGQ